MTLRGAFTTLLTNEGYLPGVLVLHRSLLDVGSRYPLVVMIAEGTPRIAVDALHRQGVQTRVIVDLKHKAGSAKANIAEHDTRLLDVWAKLRAFSLTEYDRVVLLDSDMIVRRNMDELMEMDLPRDQIAAAHVCACNIYKLPYYPADWVPENCAHTSVQHPMQVPVIEEGSPRPYTQLNSGTVVLTPSVELDAALEEFMHTSPLVPSFMFADQDLLTAFFVGRWRPLPWYYNALLWLSYVHKPLWADAEIRCLHYIGRKKPWHGRVAAEPQCQAYIDWWWAALDRLEDDLKQRDPESWKLVASGVSA